MGATSAGASSGALIKDPRYGFSFRLPSGWKSVPLNGGDVKSLLKAATHDDPALANALDSQVASETSKGMKAFGIGPISNGTASDVNVIVLSAAGVASGREFASEGVTQAKIEYAQVGAVHSKVSVVNNQLGEAAMGTYQLKTKSGIAYGTQYFVRHTSHVYVITVTAPSAASTQSSAAIIVNSWKW